MGKYGAFLACPGYPECKYIHQEKLEMKCPECSGDIVKRKSARGSFWGCSNYPKCKFAIFGEVIEKPCPKCKNPYLLVIKDKEGKVIEIKTKVLGQVLKKETTVALREMMVSAVDNGEAKWAKPKGFSAAGKTGTAQIPIQGHYDPDNTIASFIGFFPAENPKYTMLVSLTQPQTSQWGSETAAPLWFSLATKLSL